MRVQQLDIFQNLKTPSEKREQKRKLFHGGSKSLGKRKTKRPFVKNKWIHLTLKSDKAFGRYSMLRTENRKWISDLLKSKAKQFGIELKEAVNMGNHIHIKLRSDSRELFQNFLRSVTAQIARYVTGARKGKVFGKFWSTLAYTRILVSNFEVKGLEEYFEANRIQRQFGYRARKRYLAEFTEWLGSS